jgi:hypothetical protein
MTGQYLSGCTRFVFSASARAGRAVSADTDERVGGAVENPHAIALSGSERERDQPAASGQVLAHGTGTVRTQGVELTNFLDKVAEVERELSLRVVGLRCARRSRVWRHARARVCARRQPDPPRRSRASQADEWHAIESRARRERQGCRSFQQAPMREGTNDACASRLAPRTSSHAAQPPERAGPHADLSSAWLPWLLPPPPRGRG